VTDLTTTQSPSLTLVTPIAKPLELIKYHAEVAKLIQEGLTENTDYGTIPGTDKPTLLKPGAERLCLAFGATPKYTLVSAEIDHHREVQWEKKKKKWRNEYKGDRRFDNVIEQGTSIGVYRYVYKCTIVRPDGRILGECEGVCSTMESKFVDRPRDCENTAAKMAQKRAFVGAVLSAFGLSNRFTQDVEDDFVEAEVVSDSPQKESQTSKDEPTAKEKLIQEVRAAAIKAIASGVSEDSIFNKFKITSWEEIKIWPLDNS
jgi:hypothetical protein